MYRVTCGLVADMVPTSARVLVRVASGPDVPLVEVWDQVPRELRRVIDQALPLARAERALWRAELRHAEAWEALRDRRGDLEALRRAAKQRDRCADRAARLAPAFARKIGKVVDDRTVIA